MSSMEPGVARYDEIADWYASLVTEWGPGTLHELLPHDLSGVRILDVACGEGRLARELAARGAEVVAVDLSQKLISIGREWEAREQLGVTYFVGDATSIEWFDGRAFDGVVCDMALMDIDDLDGAARTVEGVVRPSGWFVFSIFHPCFPGSDERKASWPPEAGYSSEGWWNTGADECADESERTTAWFRPTSTRSLAETSGS